MESGKILQDRYRIEKQIGQGGMGSVYLATDERFNSTVAIKETLFTDENYRRAFKREARLLNSLKHNALPKVSDHFIEGNGQYIVMEYIAGHDLFEMLEQSGEAFPLEDVLVWADQLLDALEYLHSQENPIIHRDIKPQNLKITSQGQVILLDFGLAKGNPTDAQHQTAANSIFGYSRNYASLEQIQGTGTDPRSDIYSLAATLYHLVTGKPPADALTRVMLVLNEEKDPLQPAHLIHEQIPEEFSNNLQKSMSLNANLRPQTAVEMRQMLSGKQKTSVSTKPDTVSNKAVGTDLFNQNTRVFSDENISPDDIKQSEINTEVLPVEEIAGDSVRTKMAKPRTLTDDTTNTRDSAVITRSRSNRKPFLIAAAIGVLLLVGSIFSMVYLWSPAINETGDPKIGFDANAGVGNAVAVENTNSEVNLDDSNSTLTTSNTSSDESTAVNNTATKDTNKPDVAKKADKSPVKASSKNNASTVTSDNVKIKKDGTIITEDAVISAGRVETDEAIVDERGITLKNPPNAKQPPKPPITREQYEKLSPKQKQKVRDAMEKQKRLETQRQIEQDRRLRERRPPGLRNP